MKIFKYLKLSLFFFIVVSCEKNEDRFMEEKIQKEINIAFQELIKSAKTLDVNTYMKHFDETKFRGINSDGTIIASFDEFKKIYTNGVKHIKAYNSLEFSKVEISVINSTTAILVNEYSMTVLLTSGDEFSGGAAGTQMWSKEKGSWKLISVSSSDKK